MPGSWPWRLIILSSTNQAILRATFTRSHQVDIRVRIVSEGAFRPCSFLLAH